MINLLNAGFSRLFKSRAFRFSAIFLAIVSFINASNDSALTFEEGLIVTFPLTMIVMSVFIARFVAVEYEANAIRNKIIVGKKKRDIYLSNLIVCSAGSLIICIVAAAAGSVPLIFYGVTSGCAIEITLACIAGDVFAVIALSAMLCAMSMLITKTAVNSAVCILFAITLLISGDVIDEHLREPEMITWLYDDSAFFAIEDPLEQYNYFDEHAVTEPNPYYSSGTERKMLEVIQKANPFSQAITFDDAMIPDGDGNVAGINTLGYILYSIGLTALSTLLGVLLFSRKDIK